MCWIDGTKLLNLKVKDLELKPSVAHLFKAIFFSSLSLFP